jgi:hypothetical protein
MFTDESKTAIDAKACGTECGKYPPPKMSNPPTAVIPEIALVIDISGVWRAGVTPQTEKYPVMTDNEKMLVIVKMAGSVQVYPNPKTPNKPVDSVIAFFNVFLNGLIYSTTFGLCSTFAAVPLAASNIGGFGFGHKSYLFCVMMAPLTT